jgi:hypothetical protein
VLVNGSFPIPPPLARHDTELLSIDGDGLEVPADEVALPLGDLLIVRVEDVEAATERNQTLTEGAAQWFARRLETGMLSGPLRASIESRHSARPIALS